MSTQYNMLAKQQKYVSVKNPMMKNLFFVKM